LEGWKGGRIKDWMNGWKDGRVEGWMNGWMEGWKGPIHPTFQPSTPIIFHYQKRGGIFQNVNWERNTMWYAIIGIVAFFFGLLSGLSITGFLLQGGRQDEEHAASVRVVDGRKKISEANLFQISSFALHKRLYFL